MIDNNTAKSNEAYPITEAYTVGQRFNDGTYAVPPGQVYVAPNHPRNIPIAPGAQVMYYNITPQPMVTPGSTLQNEGYRGPPRGRWRDELFDCCTNIWPTCGCLCIFHGVWLVGQSN